MILYKTFQKGGNSVKGKLTKYGYELPDFYTKDEVSDNTYPGSKEIAGKYPSRYNIRFAGHGPTPIHDKEWMDKRDEQLYDNAADQIIGDKDISSMKEDSLKGFLKSLSFEQQNIIRQSKYGNMFEETLWDQAYTGAKALPGLLTSFKPELSTAIHAIMGTSNTDALQLFAPASIPARLAQSVFMGNYSTKQAAAGIGAPTRNSLAYDIITDPLNFMGVGILKALPLAAKAKYAGILLAGYKKLGRPFETLAELKRVLPDNKEKTAILEAFESASKNTELTRSSLAYSPNIEISTVDKLNNKNLSAISSMSKELWSVPEDYRKHITRAVKKGADKDLLYRAALRIYDPPGELIERRFTDLASDVNKYITKIDAPYSTLKPSTSSTAFSLRPENIDDVFQSILNRNPKSSHTKISTAVLSDYNIRDAEYFKRTGKHIDVESFLKFKDTKVTHPEDVAFFTDWFHKKGIFRPNYKLSIEKGPLANADKSFHHFSSSLYGASYKDRLTLPLLKNVSDLESIARISGELSKLKAFNVSSSLLSELPSGSSIRNVKEYFVQKRLIPKKYLQKEFEEVIDLLKSGTGTRRSSHNLSLDSAFGLSAKLASMTKDASFKANIAGFFPNNRMSFIYNITKSIPGQNNYLMGLAREKLGQIKFNPKLNKQLPIPYFSNEEIQLPSVVVTPNN